MSITMLQHFDYPESIAYEGYAGLSNASKFGKACAHFKDKTSKISLTNTTGVFNLSINGSAEAECFVKGDTYTIPKIDTFLERNLISAGCKIFNGHVFKKFTDNNIWRGKTWNEAKVLCEELGGHLPTITSKEKQSFLKVVADGYDVWLGAQKINDVWTWITGEAWNYTNWGSDEPSNNYDDFCVHMYPNGTWDATFYGNTKDFICEWDSLEAAYCGLNDYKFYNGHTFKLYENKYKNGVYTYIDTTWIGAKAACEALGGHLATSTSAEKNTFLATLTTSIAWLGGTDEETEGTWKWITGEEWNYTNWNSGQPDNSGGAEHYLEINYNSTGAWNDNTASAQCDYICEWDYDVRNSHIILRKLLLWDIYQCLEFEGHALACVYHDDFTWQQAKEKCEAIGGCLASVTSLEKQALIQSLHSGFDAWLGGQVVNGQWQWLTGETWDYTNWYSGEPSVSEDSARLKKDSGYAAKWIATTSSTLFRSICEWDSLEAAYCGLNDYKFYNGHTFKLYESSEAWSVAKAACEALGGHLATAPNAEKNAFLNSMQNGSSIWLGAQRVNDAYQWITGEEWNYTNWDSGQPDDNESCVQMFSNGYWDDTYTSNSKCYICEWDYDLRVKNSEGGGISISTGNILSIGDDSASDAEAQGYKFYNGHTYKISTEQTHWEEAKVLCEELGGHLATITSAEEEAFIESLIDGSNNYWIGGKKINDVWTWVNSEEWDYTHWSSGQPNNNGNPSEYLLFLGGNSKYWDDETNSRYGYYICEWDYDIREPRALTLSIADGGALSLVSSTWGLNETSTLTLEPDVWYHVLLRLSEGTASIYLDGVLTLSGSVSGSDIKPQSLTLGGYVGYMDEFVFRDGAGTGAPVVPTSAYETGAGLAPTSSNAPVTRAVWTCEDLPEGLTLSSSGVLSGHPTTTGTYNCDVSVATNWGTATKTINITVA